MSKNWNMNPSTGDYVMVKGAPVETESLTIPAYFRLKTKRLKWLYAPNTEFGSDLYTIKKKSASAVEAAAARALQPIADDGRAAQIDIQVKEESRHGLGLEIDILDAQGEKESLNLERIGI